MSRQFALHHYDMNYLVRAITGSRAYQLTSRTRHRRQRRPVAVRPHAAAADDGRSVVRQHRAGHRLSRTAAADRAAGVLADSTSAADRISQPVCRPGRAAHRGRDLDPASLGADERQADRQRHRPGQQRDAGRRGRRAVPRTRQQRVEALFMATLSRQPTPEETGRAGRLCRCAADRTQDAEAGTGRCVLGAAQQRRVCAATTNVIET